MNKKPWDGTMNPADFVTETYGGSYSGFIHKPATGVRLTHTPTGFVEECNEDGRSSHANKQLAWDRLLARLVEAAPSLEVLGSTCLDGGTCHHKEICTERCFRRECCAPLSASGLTLEQFRYPDCQPAPKPMQSISEDDRLELVGAVGLLTGHGHKGSAAALQRVLDASDAAPAAVAEPDEAIAKLMAMADDYANAEACAVTATSKEQADTTQERNTLQSALRAALASTPAADALTSSPALSRACDLLSSAIGTLMGQRAKIGYTDNSPIAAMVNEAVEFLHPWPEKMPVVLPEPDGAANLPYFSYDSDSGVEFHATEAEAIKSCEAALGYYREESPDGWPDEVESIKWGLVLGRSEQCDVQPVEDHPEFTETCDYQLKPYAAQARDDSALLDAMEQKRIAVVPEYEGPWDAEVYNDDGKPNHRGSGSTPREAIRAAIAAKAAAQGDAA